MVKDAFRIAELEKLLAERTAELIQQSEELSVINSVQEALVQEMDMQAIYDLVGNKIQELFDAQVVMIATFDHEAGTETFQYMFENGERFYPESRPYDKLRTHLIDTKQKILINTAEEGFTWFGGKVLPGTKDLKAGLFVPLISGEKITSYISLQNVDKEYAFSESDVRLLETLANSMSTALQNARLLKETEQRTAELAVINSVQEGLAKELDIQAIYDLVGDRIRNLFDAQVVGIATFDHDKQTEHIQYLIEKGERYYPAPLPLNILRKHLIQTKEKILINKNFEEVAATFGVKKLPGTELPRSALYVPLVIGDKVTGYTSLQNIDKENAFSDSDVRLLETLANTMGVALENARLFDETTRLLKETEQQKAELGVINSVQEGLAKELDMQAIYDLVGDRIQELFNAQAVIIATFDHDAATESFKYLIEDGQRFYLAPRPYDKLRRHLIMTRQKMVINTNYEEAVARFDLKILPGTNMTKSGVFVPLIIGDKVNSYISLQNMEIENAFSESDIRLLETLANSMSVALENARLFDETNRLLKETEQRTAELAVINSVQEGLARELDMQAIYDLVGNKIREVFDAQVVIIASFDHDNGTEKFNYMIEKGEQFYPDPRRYDKLRYQLIMTKQKILFNNNVTEALSEFGLKLISGTEMPKSILYVPLIVGNKVTSYVSLQNLDKENAFSESDVRLLETLANSMSVALENARLFDETNRLLKETEQGKAELAVINSVQEGLVREMDIQGIYNLVGDRVQKLFTAQCVIIATFDHEKKLEYFNYHIEKGELSHPDPRRFDKVRQHLIDTGQNILINEDYPKAAAEFGMKVVPGTEAPKSLLFMPLKVGDKVTGYVSLQNIDQENAFSFSDIRLLSTLANSMSVALENARLFDETNRLLKVTEHRTAELSVINSVQEGLAKELHIQGIYELVGEKVREIFNAQVIDIVTYDRSTNLIEDRYSFEKGDRTLAGSRVPIGFRKHLIDTGQLLLINEDLENKSIEFNSPVVQGEQPKSLVFVPLISGNEVKGMISLQDLDKEHAFSDSDVRLLVTLANSMTVALENARLFDETNRLLKETEQRTAELSVINSVQEGLAKELDIQGIYELVGEKVREIFNAQVIDIVTYDKKTNLIEDRYAYEKGDRTLVGSWEPAGFRKHVIDTAQLLLINEELDKKSIEFSSTVIHGELPKSVVFVPLTSGNEVKGMISLQDLDRDHAFSDSDVRLLVTLANSMSVALQNARLFDETNRLLKETEQRNAELAVINSVQESLVAKMDMQGIYELVGEKIREIFDAQVIDIVMYDHYANLLEDRYSYEKGDRTLVGPREPKGFRKHIIQTKQLLLHNEHVLEAMREYDNEVLIGEVPKSHVYVPMIAGGEVKGIISLQNLDHEQAFSVSDVNLLTTLANSMSVALESARLFDETNRLLKETEQRNAELAVINSVQESLVAKMDMQGIYELVGEKIREIFDAQVIDIVTYDNAANLIEDRYAYEKGDRTLIGSRQPKGFRKHVIETRQLLLHNENVPQAILDYGNEILIGEMPKSQVYVPMIAVGEVKGIISLQNLDHEHAFSSSDVNLLTTLANSMSVALESARLFDETTRLLNETEQRTAELSVINSVQQGLAKELDIQGIYELVGEKMREIFSAQVIDIVTYDPKLNLIEDRYSFEKGDTTLLGPREPKGFRKHIITTGQQLVINKDFDRINLQYNNTILIGEHPKSAVLVPMKSGGKVNGMISLQNLDHENAFSDSDVNLLNTLANSMSVALENARLFDETNRLLKETEQRTAELSVINSVQEGLAKELDIQGIYELVGEKMRAIFNAQVIDIVTYDKTTDLIEDRYTYEKGDRTLLGARPLKGFRRHVIETAKPFVINKDVDLIRTQYDQTVIIGVSAKSLVFVPMIAGAEVTGVISLQNLDQENAFPDSDVNLLTTFANSMSVALENARLFDETTRLLKETEQRTAELAVINSVQDGLAKELDMQGIYNLVGDRVQKLFNAQAVIIASFDMENKTEHFNYAFENDEIVILDPRPINTLRQLLIDRKKSIYIATEEQAKEAYGLTAIAATEMPKSLLFVPMLTGNIIRGYVSLQNIDTENAFSGSDIRLLETLASSMSVALENARLFDETSRLLKETEQRTAELAVINSVQEGLAKELDMEGIYNLVGDRVQNLFTAQSVIIASFDAENQHEYFNYFFENGEKFKAEPRPLNKLRQQLIEQKHSIYISTSEQAINEYGLVPIGDTQMPKSLLFVPLLTGNIIRGYVSLQNIDTENAFSASDIRLLETLASSMSVALENARLFDETSRLLKETEQRTAELGIINSVQEGLASKLDIQAVYDLVGDKIRDVFDTQGISISFYDRQKNFITHPYYLFKGKRIEELGFELGKGLTSHVIQTAQPLLINENAKERFEELGAVFAVSETAETAKSWLGVPLISGGKVNGTIRLENYEREFAYTESDVSLLQTLANSMSVALENARLFDETNRLLNETEQRTAELAVINSVQEGLAKELDMQGIYNLVGDRLCELFPDSQTLVIRTFDHDTGFEHWHYAKEKGILQIVEPRPFNWNSKQLIATKKPLDIQENYIEVSKQHGGTGVTFGRPPKSAVFVPMMSGDTVKGSISLQNVDKENAFTDSDLRLLTTITNSMSVALENARLFAETTRLLNETKQRTGELAVINSVQEGLVREMDMQAIYEIVGDRLCNLFNIQTVVIRTFDHETGLEHWQYAKEKGARQYVEPRPFNWNSKQLIATKKPLDIKENYLETSKKYGGTGVTTGEPPKSAVFVPMIVGDVVKGSVSLQNVDKENAFSESDLSLLTTLTNSMSVALENARLFDETTLLLGESKQRAAELSTVNSISKALASQLDPDDLIQMVGDQLKNLFKANIVYLALLNQKTKIIYFPYQYGDDMPPLKLGDGLTSKIILNGEPLLINKDLQELRMQMGVKQIGVPAASYLGVPIPVGDENIGVLSVQSTEHENQFNENDLRLLSTIASSVGVALNNATLFEDVKQAKMEAEAASKAAEKANEAKSAFLSTVSHELRTPLTSVLGFAKIIRKRLDEKIFPIVNHTDAKTEKTVAQISENLQVVISEGERLTHLINDVLDLAKIEAGKMEWNQENVSLPEVAERAIAATTSLFDQKSLKLIKEIDPDLPEITGDKDKLIQVMINLISNSVKFTNKGSVTCKVFCKKNELVVSIADTGIGIAPEDFSAVFEQFKQVGGDTLTDKPKGTGLGLPICKEIVEHHGGRIWLESQPGKGSTFSFAIPLNKTEETRPVHLDDLVRQLKEQVAHSRLKVNGHSPCILIVDDDDSIRSLLHQELGDQGYMIEEAKNGKEALACVRKQRPDLIILDIMMPEMNGFDVAAVLKNDPQTMDIPIIVLSIVQDKARGFRIGVDRYLTKPIDTNLLFAEIGSLLEQGKSKKKVMIVDEDSGTVNALVEVLTTKGYEVTESKEKELIEKAVAHQPDIIIINSVLSGHEEFVKTLRFEKGLENVLFLVYQ